MGVFDLLGHESYTVRCQRCNEELTLTRGEVEAGQYGCPACGHVAPVPDHIQAQYEANRAREKARRTEKQRKQQENEERHRAKQARQQELQKQKATQQHVEQKKVAEVEPNGPRVEAHGITRRAKEETLYESHPSMFRNNPVGFALAVVMIPLGIGLIVLLIWWLRVVGTTLIVTGERSTLREGILSKRTNEVYHEDVRNLRISQGVFGRMFGVGTLSISSAGQAGIELTAPGMPNPHRVKEIIDRQRRQAR